MSKKVDSWMPLHIGRYKAATGHLTSAEHGMYLLILMHAWNAGGVIPGDYERLMRIAGATPKEWAKSRTTIIAFLIHQPDGTYRQKTLDAELAKASDLKNERSNAGSKGAASRWQKDGKGMAQPLPNDMANACPIPIPEQEPNTPPSPPRRGGSVDKSKSKPRPETRWWLSDAGITAEGKRRGIPARAGESFPDYAARIREARTPEKPAVEQPAEPPQPEPQSTAGEGWWDDPEKIAHRAAEEGVIVIPNQSFEDFTARVLAASGPGPWLEAQDPDMRARIASWLANGINPSQQRQQGRQPVPAGAST